MKRFHKSCKASNINLKELKYSKAKHYEIHESERKSIPKIQPNHRLLKLQHNQRAVHGPVCGRTAHNLEAPPKAI